MRQDSSGRRLAPRHPARIFGPGLILAAGLIAGCAPSDPWARQAISGTVTLDGRPVVDGVILLEPPSPNEWGMTIGATIQHGSFAIPQTQGPTSAEYLVRIYSGTGAEAPPAGGPTDHTGQPMVERIPAIYNAKSELRVRVDAEGPNRFRFDLHAASGG